MKKVMSARNQTQKQQAAKRKRTRKITLIPGATNYHPSHCCVCVYTSLIGKIDKTNVKSVDTYLGPDHHHAAQSKQLAQKIIQ